jgi:predicted Rossmann fold flavoprotein
MQEYIVIGGGASGLCASITLARAGYKVVILEQNKKVAKKLLASGNGKCNITNKNISPKFFYSQNRDFVAELLDGYGYEKIEEFFHSIGIHLTTLEDSRVFPASLQASSVVEALVFEAISSGVHIVTECQITSIDKKENHFTIQSQHQTYTSQNLIIATGSPAFTRLGGSHSGYNFASRLNHPIIPQIPSLVPLVSDDKTLAQCSGVKIQSEVKLYANGEFIAQKSGDLLFSDYGVSGLAILDISKYVSVALSNFEYCELRVDLMPKYSKERLINMMLQTIQKDSNKPLWLYLNGLLNHKLAKLIIQKSKTKAKYEKDLNRKEITKLVYNIKNLSIPIVDTVGFEKAEVSLGGIDTNYINAQNLQSKLVPNLYFLGEVLDVTGDRGGYNLHFAWVCGMRVANIGI